MPVFAVRGDGKVHISEVVITFLSCRYSTVDLSPLDRNGLGDGVVQAAHGVRIRMESLSSDNDLLTLSVGRATTGESFSHVIYIELKVFMIVIPSVKSDLQVHLITSAPTSG